MSSKRLVGTRARLFRNVGDTHDPKWEEASPTTGKPFVPTYDEEAFLSAILAEPGDDTSRLVYADWLDEHDRPERAEFIRLGIELARSADPACASHRELRARGSAILNLRNPLADNEHVGDAWFTNGSFRMVTHGAAGPFWLYPTNPPYARCFEAEIVRGFVGAVRCEGNGWAEHGDALLRFQPVTRVGFRYPPHLGRDVGGYYLTRDPKLRAFSSHQLDRARLPDDPSRDSVLGTVLPLMRLRWPGVAFLHTPEAEATDLGTAPAVHANDADDSAPEPAEASAITVCELAASDTPTADRLGPSLRRTFAVNGTANQSVAAFACGVFVGEPHPTYPTFTATGFDARPALGINNAWNVTVTYRPAEDRA